MTNTIKLIAACAVNTPANGQKVLKISVESDPEEQATEVQNADVVELHFPKFSDGRAFSQAVVLRRRLGFKGDIRATGDVAIDQLLQMQRTGFSSAVLREGQDTAHAQKLLTQFAAFYQGDAQNTAPLFARPQLAGVA
jgi:uncharacterized protein (DUF934 family)